jgi:hypothetical protein
MSRLVVDEPRARPSSSMAALIVIIRSAVGAVDRVR